jgi:hypothetical protein
VGRWGGGEVGSEGGGENLKLSVKDLVTQNESENERQSETSNHPTSLTPHLPTSFKKEWHLEAVSDLYVGLR